MGQLLNLATGALSYLVFAGIGGLVGYYFARKRTEHEVGYGRRVEVVERIQSLVVSLAEEFEAALAYIREPGPTGELPAKTIESSIDELERYYVQQEIWLNRETLGRLEALVAGCRARQAELARLPRRYGDPNFEREYARVGAYSRSSGGFAGLPRGPRGCYPLFPDRARRRAVALRVSPAAKTGGTRP